MTFRNRLKKILYRSKTAKKIIQAAVYNKRVKHYKSLSDSIKTNDKQIIFESFRGRNYNCSPKAIYQYMKSDIRFTDFEFIWIIRKIEKREEEGTFPEEIKGDTIIEYGSEEYFRAYAGAKYWITNSRLPRYINKKADQVYVQCWHGTPLKRLGNDINVAGSNALYSKSALQDVYDKDVQRYSYMISPSRFCTEKYISAFGLEENNDPKIVIEEGYPRNDYLFRYTEEDAKAIKAALGINGDDTRKIILYAPTWRDNQHENGVGYTYELGLDFKKLQQQIGSEYIILFRPHYFIANKFDFDEFKGFVYDVSKVEDINQVYVISDMLMTDYSSVFFDYANLKRPMLFYMYDLYEYKNNMRDFYFSLNELPGMIVEKEDELADAIRSTYENFLYDEKYRKFNERFTYLDDANSSERVMNRIMAD